MLTFCQPFLILSDILQEPLQLDLIMLMFNIFGTETNKFLKNLNWRLTMGGGSRVISSVEPEMFTPDLVKVRTMVLEAEDITG